MSDLSEAHISAIAWSKSRPRWQREALRRLTLAKLTTEDIATLADLAIDEAVGGDASFSPIDASHLPAPTTTARSVVLQKIWDVRNVNQLAPGQELVFGAFGLTLIYGDNGAGKSGYARILRQTCRTRGASREVLPNLLSSVSRGVPSARIDFTSGVEQDSYLWIEHAVSDVPLKHVQFFDTHAAAHLLDKEGDTAFSPQVLTLLQDLAQACKAVEKVLDARIRESDLNSLDTRSLDGDTSVGRAIGQLGVKGHDDKLKRLATITAEEERRYEELGRSLEELRKADPTTRAKLHRSRAAQLAGANVKQRAERLLAVVADSKVVEARELAIKVSELQTAAEAAAKLVEGSSLEAVGGETWLKLWEAARSYSNAAAYHDQNYPYCGGDARCVLCQQPLSENTKQLFVSLEQFVRDTTAAELQAERQKARNRLSSAEQTLVSNELKDGILGALGEEYAPLEGRLIAASNAAAVRVAFIAGLLGGTVSPDAPIPPEAHLDTEAILLEVSQAIASEEKQAEELEGKADPQARERLEAEYAELHARTLLRAGLENVLAEQARKVEVGHIRAAKDYCKTNGITTKQSDLSKQLITERLKELFGEELRSLGAGRLQLSIAAAPGKLGKMPHKLSFSVPIQGTASLSDVLSEGECRAVALAGFLVEVSMVDDGSAIVLDDPVSSLDHRYMRHVAERLVKEAARRQVVVFTHSLSFVEAIHKYADRVDVPVRDVQIKRTHVGVGVCVEEPMDVGASATARLKAHRQKVQANRKLYTQGADDEWAAVAADVTAGLRATLERAVEGNLLNDSVTRFDRPIRTNQLRSVTVTDEDWKLINEVMSDLSEWTKAHDNPAVSNDAPPTPDELDKVIGRLDAWLKEVAARQSAARLSRPKA